ncbi:MAG: thiol protease/hemagglutinin PrtT [Bacteroidales bacterium]|nr:thiol protease/hemagglutinin PrtT [Bacteroidales bacterium]
MKIKHILFLLALIPTAAQPANRSSDIAQAIAQRFYSQLRPDARRSASALKQTFPKLITRTNDTIDAVEVCYAYNFGDSDGFVLVRSDDALPEILGYSTNGRIPEEALPENLSHWLLGYRAGDHASEAFTWNASDSILPVMEAIQWNQLAPYNNDCPISSTYQERCATGCVATAMAQIMKYYEWPPEGVGQKSYSLTITETDTTISEIFDGTFYDWANMQNHYNGTQTAIQQAAVAKLMYHCGVAAEMNYGIASQGGSGASVRNAGLGLLNHFNYDDALHLIHRMHFDSDDWTERILQELRNKRPILYSGIADSGVGHAFVMDGFDSNGFLHINWGWGGYANGYYQMNALDPTATGVGGGDGGYYYNHTALIGIQQPDNSPVHPEFYIGMYNEGIRSDTNYISNLRKEGYITVQYGFLNYGLHTFGGSLGLGLFKDDLLVTSLFAQSVGSLLPGYGYQRYSKTISLNKGLADGSYEMRLYFEENGIKTPFYTRDSLNNHLMVTFLGNTATIETPTSSNDSLTQLTTITQNTRPTQAEVYDLTGKRLLQASDPEHLRIDRLPTGLFLLRTRTIKGEQTSKFYKP